MGKPTTAEIRQRDGEFYSEYEYAHQPRTQVASDRRYLLASLTAIGIACNEMKDDYAPEPPPFDADELIRTIESIMEPHNEQQEQ